MKASIHFLACIGFLCILSCNTPAGTNAREDDLTDFLRDIPGLSVAGSGSSAIIRIRAIGNYSGSGEPLFVVNGAEISGGYRGVYESIDPDDITSVRVISLATDLRRYGQMGINGVIEIQTI